MTRGEQRDDPAQGRRPGWSLRGRLTALFAALLAGSLTAYSAAVAWTFTIHAGEELDRRVHEDIELAGRTVTLDEAGRPAWPGGFVGKAVPEEDGGGHWLEVFDERGVRLLATGTLDDPGLPPPVPGALSRAETVAGRSGKLRLRADAMTVGRQRLVVRAFVSQEAARRQVVRLWHELGFISFAVLVAGSLGGWLLAGRALGPLARMADHARRITVGHLQEPLVAEGGGIEVEMLRDAFTETFRRLDRSFGELRRFSADASHELRTPLTAIRSVGEVALQRERRPEEYREVIATMLEEVDRLSRLVGELLGLARAEADTGRLRWEDVDLARLASDVVESLSVLAEDREQTLETRLEGPALVHGDRLALRQAVLNLVDNAIKYAPERTVIRVAASRVEGTVVLEVADEGPGIAPEHRERVFERFYRVDASRSRELGGTGLGLSLVKRTAESHGGRVTLRSEVGSGSAFRLELPAARVPRA